jgi:hypothetical protein
VFALRGISLTKVTSSNIELCTSINVSIGFDCYLFLLEKFQIESRPQKQRPLRVVDDYNEGRAK